MITRLSWIINLTFLHARTPRAQLWLWVRGNLQTERVRWRHPFPAQLIIEGLFFYCSWMCQIIQNSHSNFDDIGCCPLHVVVSDILSSCCSRVEHREYPPSYTQIMYCFLFFLICISPWRSLLFSLPFLLSFIWYCYGDWSPLLSHSNWLPGSHHCHFLITHNPLWASPLQGLLDHQI